MLPQSSKCGYGNACWVCKYTVCASHSMISHMRACFGLCHHMHKHIVPACAGRRWHVLTCDTKQANLVAQASTCSHVRDHAWMLAWTRPLQGFQASVASSSTCSICDHIMRRVHARRSHILACARLCLLALVFFSVEPIRAPHSLAWQSKQSARRINHLRYRFGSAVVCVSPSDGQHTRRQRQSQIMRLRCPCKTDSSEQPASVNTL